MHPTPQSANLVDLNDQFRQRRLAHLKQLLIKSLAKLSSRSDNPGT